MSQHSSSQEIQPTTESGLRIQQASDNQERSELVTSHGSAINRPLASWPERSSLAVVSSKPLPDAQHAELPALATVEAVEQANSSEFGDFFRFEQHRLESFPSNWPLTAPVQPEQLAAAGLYYYGVDDMVRCAFCQGLLQQWAPNDDPMEEHRKFFKNCPFVQGQTVGNVPIRTNLTSSRSFPVEFRQGMFEQQRTPLYPAFKDCRDRLRSFSGKQLPVGQSADELAGCGFYYIGPEDAVQCFSCGGSLKNWLATDKPWSEHVRWFPHCAFLQKDSSSQSATARNVPHESSSSIQVEPTSIEGSYPIEEGRQSSELPRVQGASEQGASNKGMKVLQEENRRLKDTFVCKVCMDNEVNMVFLPCRHLACCENCAVGLNVCPMCRADIRGSIRTFL